MGKVILLMQSCMFVEDTALGEGLQQSFRVFPYYSRRFAGFSFSPRLSSFLLFFPLNIPQPSHNNFRNNICIV